MYLRRFPASSLSLCLLNSDAVSSAPTLADNDLQMLNLVCPMCDQQFDDAEVLQLHAQTHFEERPATSSQ